MLIDNAYIGFPSAPFKSLRTKATLLSILTRRRRAFLYLVRKFFWVISKFSNVVGYMHRFLGILNNTSTTLGRSLLRTWLLRPSLSLDVINARHDAVECFILPNNWPVCDQMHSHLKGIKNVPRILGVLKSGRAGVSDWQGLVKVCFRRVSSETLLLIYLAVHVSLCNASWHTVRTTRLECWNC